MAIKLKNISDMSREEWLKMRKIGIGGSDAAAIAGLNPWKSAFGVYLDKTSDLIRESEDNERMRVGRDLEEYVAKRFEEATGKKVRRNNFMLQSEDYPFMIADLDREIVGERALLECKTTNSYAKKEWLEGVPTHYEIQVLHYLAVTGLDKAYIACLIGNEAFVYHEIERDEETINFLIEIERKFWEDLQNGIEPDPDGSSDYDEMLKLKFSKSIENEVPLDIDNGKIERLEELKGLKKEVESKIKVLEQEIKKAIGENEAGFTDSFKVTWKPQTRNSIDSKRLKEELPEIAEEYTQTSTTRVLRIKEIKNND